MTEQLVLIRHGYSFGNRLNAEDHNYVQGPRSGLEERGYRQIGWSALELVKLVSLGEILPPTVICHADVLRQLHSAQKIQEVYHEHTGIMLPLRSLAALEEKREPDELEDKTGSEILADPRLRRMQEMILHRHLDDEYAGEDGIEIRGFETWPQVFARISLFLREIIQTDENPVLVTSNGPASIARAQLDHNLNLMLHTESVHPPHGPGIITPQQLFDEYLFRMGNAEGVVYQRNKESCWMQTQGWRRPEGL